MEAIEELFTDCEHVSSGIKRKKDMPNPSAYYSSGWLYYQYLKTSYVGVFNRFCLGDGILWFIGDAFYLNEQFGSCQAGDNC